MIPNCTNCKTTGLAITLARYSVVPAFAQTAMPPGIGGERVKDVRLDPKQFGYALRAMRAGYLYVFYTQGKYGTNYWETFTVNHDGSMLMQASHVAMAAPKPAVVCRLEGHNAARTMYFCIEEPEKCGKVWIAFSEHNWSRLTLDRYAGSDALRKARMQLFEPMTWITSGQNLHACEAIPDNLEKVLEYMASASMEIILQPKPGKISKSDGEHDDRELQHCTSM